MDLSLVYDLAAAQLGLVTRPQLLALGLSDDRITGLIRRGRLRVEHVGVYRVPGAPSSSHLRVLAAVMAAGSDAVASHQTALWLHGLDAALSLKLDVTVAVTTDARITGATAHRTRGLDKQDVTSVGVIPVTSVPRTMIDVAPMYSEPRLGRFFDRALTKRLVTSRELKEAVDRLSAGRHGIAKLRRLLVARCDEPMGMESTGQQWLYRPLVDEGYQPLVEFPIHDERGLIVASADCAFAPPVCLDCEYDGDEAHNNPATAAADRRRDAKLASLGWHTLRADATTRNDPRDFLAAIAARFAEKGVLVPGRA